MTPNATPLTAPLARWPGVRVLARLHQGEPIPITYANRTQAQAAAEKHAGWVWQGYGRPFYVRLDAKPSTPPTTR